jgi:hypothetical protein
MQRRFLVRLSFVVAAIGLVVTLLAANAQDAPRRGRKYKSPPPTSRIEVTVLRDVNGKPIENAAVIFHSIEGDRDKGNMELKTNEDGKTVIDVLPIGGKVRLQIIAKGFQTFGEDYQVDKAEMTIEIKMKRPGEQYSIYKKPGATADAGKSSDADKTAPPAKDAAPAEAKPADTAKPQPTQPPSK